MFIALFIMAKNWNQHKSPSTGECLNKLGTAIPQKITRQFVPQKKGTNYGHMQHFGWISRELS